MTRLTAKALALEIKRLWPALDVSITRGFSSTDRRLAGTRLIHKGKGRTGSRIIVRECRPCARCGGEGGARGIRCARCYGSGRVWATLLDHNQAETYRRLSEVEEWIRRRRLDR